MLRWNNKLVHCRKLGKHLDLLVFLDFSFQASLCARHLEALFHKKIKICNKTFRLGVSVKINSWVQFWNNWSTKFVFDNLNFVDTKYRTHINIFKFTPAWPNPSINVNEKNLICTFSSQNIEMGSDYRSHLLWEIVLRNKKSDRSRCCL